MRSKLEPRARRRGRRAVARAVAVARGRAVALATTLAAMLLLLPLAGCEDMGEQVIDDGPLECPPVSFEQDVEPLLASSCALAGCHVPPGYAGGLDLRAGQSYSSLTAAIDPLFQLKVVEPGNLERSMLYRRLEGDTDFGIPMPPSPRPPLAADELHRIYCWIEQGALQN